MSFGIQNLLILSYILHLLQIALWASYLWYRKSPKVPTGSISQPTFPQDKALAPSSVAAVSADARTGAAPAQEPQTSVVAVGQLQATADLPPLFSQDELAAAKQRAEYQDDLFHFAVVGRSDDGRGLSFLVEAFLGIESYTGPSEISSDYNPEPRMSRRPDPNPGRPYAWYSVWARGSLDMSELDYFKGLSLYVFDCVIIQIDLPLTLMQTILLANCQRYNIPTYIVWSKVDEYFMVEMEGAIDSVENMRDRLVLAIRKTQQNVQAHLKSAGLSDQRVYIVSLDTLRRIVQKKMSSSDDLHDELELCRDLFTTHIARRNDWWDSHVR